jgi:PhnB protein
MKPHFQPPGFHSLTPSLTLHDCAAGIEFYKKAFNAVEHYRLPMPDGKIMHAEFQIGDSVVMCNDEMPDWGALSPKTIGGTPSSMMIYVEDADAIFAQAIAAGATQVSPPTDMFWGDRSACVICPFGFKWSIGTHIEDVSREEIAKRAAEWSAAGAA